MLFCGDIYFMKSAYNCYNMQKFSNLFVLICFLCLIIAVLGKPKILAILQKLPKNGAILVVFEKLSVLLNESHILCTE